MNREPWTGCHKISEGCTYCYFYGPYSKRFGQNAVQKTNPFKQGCAAKELGIDTVGTRKLF